MAMKRFALVLGLVVLASACEKPSEENCRKALTNVRSLLGTEAPEADKEGDVRRCKGGSTKKTVECAMNATSIEQLQACGFFKTMPKKDSAGAPAPAGGAPAPAGGAPAPAAPAGGTPAPAGGTIAPAGSAPPTETAPAGSPPATGGSAAGSAK
jgi:hypothetical protein